jgi:hypothetical protein
LSGSHKTSAFFRSKADENERVTESKLSRSIRSLKKNADTFRKGQIAHDLGTLSQTFIGGTRSYKTIVDTIVKSYISAPHKEYVDQIRGQLFESYEEKRYTHARLIDGKGDKRYFPFAILAHGSYAIPRLLIPADYDSSRDNWFIEVKLPRQFIWSESMDPQYLCSIQSGYIPGDCTRFEVELRNHTEYAGMTSLPRDEECILRYLYTLFPFVPSISRKRWVQALLHANSNGMERAFIGETRRLLLEGTCVSVSEDCIPFEIEGRLITTTFDNLWNLIQAYRTSGQVYPIGACDDERKLLITLYWVDKGLLTQDEAILALKFRSFQDVMEEVTEEAPAFKLSTNDIEWTDEEVYFYYASDAQRKEIINKINIDEERRRVIETAREFDFFGFRARMESLMADRNVDLTNFHVEHDNILYNMSERYGTSVSRRILYEASVLSEDDDPYDFDMFEEIDDSPYDSTDKTFEVEFKRDLIFGNDPLDLARTVWDPGGGSSQEAPGTNVPGINWSDS